MSEASYMFVDGGYFQQVLKKMAERHCENEEIPVNFRLLFNGFEKVFYYDCPPHKRSGEPNADYELRTRQFETLIDRIRQINGFHVFLGQTSGEGRRARQKGVDIQIAVHMLTHSFRNNAKWLTLLTGDLDFKPLIEALVREGSYVTLLYDEQTTRKELADAADAKERLTTAKVFATTRSHKDFADRHHIPEEKINHTKLISDKQLVAQAQTSKGDAVELWQSHGIFTAIAPTTQNDWSQYLHISSGTAERVRALLAEYGFSIEKWNKLVS